MARRLNRIQAPRPGYFKRLCDRIKNYLVEFCQQTSLHGFHHIMKHEKSTIFKSLFFTIACCCSVSLCLYLIILQIYDNNAKSVISTITSTAYPIWKVPFPAVTICNINAVQKDQAQEFKKIMESYHINNETLDDFFINLKSLINFDEVQNSSKYDEIFKALNSSGYGIDNMMQMLTKSCNDMMESCSWQTHNVSCTDIFQQIKTTHGYCCSFNYFGIQKFVNEVNNKDKIRYRYAKGAGSTFSLQVHLKSNESQYTSAIQNSIGFTVQVQDSFNYPDLDFISNTLEQNTIMTISARPRIYASSELLRYMPIQSRNCLFADEGNLRWSSMYTFSNCISECLTHSIFKYCNCIPFYYPEDDATKFCTFKDIECLYNNMFNYSALIDPNDFSRSPEDMNEDQSTIMDCKCYPECNENMLDFHIDQSKKTNTMNSNASILTVFYNDVGCIKTEREIYFTWDRLLGSIGGIFGLCIGGSLISLLEIMYFFIKGLIYYEKPKTKHGQTYKGNKFSKVYVQDFKHHKHNINDEHNLKQRSAMQPQIEIIFNALNAK